MAGPRNQGEVYTQQQIETYLSKISFPVTKYKTVTPATTRTEEGLEYLSKLQIYHLASVPFENLSLHYSKERVISLDKDDLYEKIVGLKTGGGGYCMEQNTFFGVVMRALGYEVFPTGARVMTPGGLTGWSHYVNLVPIAGSIYLVDVGFGGNGATRPMSLLHGEVFQWGATDAQMRLIYREPANPIVQGIWTLEHRISKSHDWTPSYEFGMTEFLQEDFEVMNYATSSRRTSFFTWSIVCLKMVLDRDLEDITGAMILTGKSVKRRLFGESEVVVECSNESQRVAALSEHFGIDLSKRGTSKYQGYFDRSQRRLEASKDKESERRGAGL